MITIDLEIGESVRIGPDVRVAILDPHTFDGRVLSRAIIGIACPPAVRIHRDRLPPPRRAVPGTVPGATPRPGPPIRRRPAKGGAA